MSIGQRIRQLRERKNLSQGDIERRTGLLQGYISRVEHGRTVPSIETLGKFAAALNVPLYRLFHPAPDEPATAAAPGRPGWTLEDLAQSSGNEGSEARFLLQLKDLVGHMEESDRAFLLGCARRFVSR
ncbi:MAG TPA: helix-turn-helix transcriptional regulator [Terriglobia bacterium]|nr:helix-turn-helix transcriptional regulator [Terriglobia bacterium]